MPRPSIWPGANCKAAGTWNTASGAAPPVCRLPAADWRETGARPDRRVPGTCRRRIRLPYPLGPALARCRDAGSCSDGLEAVGLGRQLMTPEIVCPWCGRSLHACRRGGSPQKFCCATHRAAFHSAARRWAERAVSVGLLTADDLKADPAACTLLPVTVSPAAAQGCRRWSCDRANLAEAARRRHHADRRYSQHRCSARSRPPDRLLKAMLEFG